MILGSYFDVPLGEKIFDAAVSVESLHHFTKEEKVALYSKLHKALKDNGYFILTDYFSLSDEEEQMHRRNLLALKAEQGITDNEFYHYDTPLTVKHETDALIKAGFASAEVLRNWGATQGLARVSNIGRHTSLPVIINLSNHNSSPFVSIKRRYKKSPKVSSPFRGFS